jgi:hypothetical protein
VEIWTKADFIVPAYSLGANLHRAEQYQNKLFIQLQIDKRIFKTISSYIP